MVIINVENSDVIMVELNCVTLNASNCDDVYEGLSRVIKKARQIVIDISSMEIMDSSGLGTLLNFYRDLKALGGTMTVVAVNPLILSLFQLVHFNQIIKIHRDVPKAVEYLKAS